MTKIRSSTAHLKHCAQPDVSLLILHSLKMHHAGWKATEQLHQLRLVTTTNH